MARKTGKLNKVEKFYIENNPDRTASDIAADLNRTVNCVKKYLSEELGRDTESEEKISPVGDLMARREDRGVTIMTPNASQMADETRSNEIKLSATHKSSIYIINKDK